MIAYHSLMCLSMVLILAEGYRQKYSSSIKAAAANSVFHAHLNFVISISQHTALFKPLFGSNLCRFKIDLRCSLSNLPSKSLPRFLGGMLLVVPVIVWDLKRSGSWNGDIDPVRYRTWHGRDDHIIRANETLIDGTSRNQAPSKVNVEKRTRIED
jgi:hypothetical protein